MFSNIYAGKRVLVTGHTGFKGSWLAYWLSSLGAEVVGIALPPEKEPNHWNLLGLDIQSVMVDIRDESRLAELVPDINPDIIFHLAAQPLVRASYQEPLVTWQTNVLGTANLLEACRNASNVSSILVVTTDKCYENKEWYWGYRESDSLGGHDPYSASKAGTEMLVNSYRCAFFSKEGSPLLATARAGNVIGGGDWSMDRLIPDLVRAVESQSPLTIRYPAATRPWQHVLDCLSGYLVLGQKLLEGESACADAWNFGPDSEANCNVEDVLSLFKSSWEGVCWDVSADESLHEASMLQLDVSKARYSLGWKSTWSLEQAVLSTAVWYKTWYEDHRVLTENQIKAFTESALKNHCAWA